MLTIRGKTAFQALFTCAAFLCAGCESEKITPLTAMTPGAEAQAEIAQITPKPPEDAPPDGSRVLLSDGGDCVIRVTSTLGMTITFAGAKPNLMMINPFLDAHVQQKLGRAAGDDLMSSFFSLSFTAMPGTALPMQAARQIRQGGCGAPAARRAAQRMLTGPYRLIGTDAQGHRLAMTVRLTEQGKRLLTDAMEDTPPATAPATSQSSE